MSAARKQANCDRSVEAEREAIREMVDSYRYARLRDRRAGRATPAMSPMNEDVERKLIELRNRAVSSIMGFTFVMAQEFHHADRGKATKRWLDQADRLPSIDDAVTLRFGEAHAFWSRDREVSRRRWLATLDAEVAV